MRAGDLHPRAVARGLLVATRTMRDERGSEPKGSRYWVSGYPQLVREWDPDRNGTLTPDAVTAGSGRSVWWSCAKGLDHRWRAKPNNRSLGTGCPFCANRRVSVTNSLATRWPYLAAEWHPTNNGAITPDHVLATSTRVAWWRCSARPNHEWRARVRDRSRAQTACPYCSGRRVCLDNSLMTRHPALAAQWHPSRNGAPLPSDVLPGSRQRVWWQCPRDPAHEWRATVENRVLRASGCPFVHAVRSAVHRRPARADRNP